jgi:hypothetical protein
MLKRKDSTSSSPVFLLLFLQLLVREKELLLSIAASMPAVSTAFLLAVGPPPLQSRLVCSRSSGKLRQQPLELERSGKGYQDAEDEASSVPGNGTYVSRRNAIQSSAAAIVGSASSANFLGASAASSTSTPGLLADVPMIRLQLPGNGGEGFVAMQICLQNSFNDDKNNQQQQPYEFMLDTGLTLELVTPHFRRVLAEGSTARNSDENTDYGATTKKSLYTGLTAAGSSSIDSSSMVELKGLQICSSGSSGGSTGALDLPVLHAIISDFPQEHLDPKHDPVEGMLGMELLSRYDVELDFRGRGRIRLYRPGMAPTSELVEIPAVVINESEILGVRVAAGDGPSDRPLQPVLGLIDCGSTFSVVNWSAARILGLPTNPSDPVYQKGPRIVALGVDGRPVELPLIRQSLQFTGDAKVNAQGQLLGFERVPTCGTKPIQLAVGDLPVFAELLGDGRQKYNGPAALIGLDILAQQQRVLIQAGTGSSRKRSIFVTPSKNCE